jgi:hypothetical protein
VRSLLSPIPWIDDRDASGYERGSIPCGDRKSVRCGNCGDLTVGHLSFERKIAVTAGAGEAPIRLIALTAFCLQRFRTDADPLIP